MSEQNNELNKKIHEWLYPGRHWHEWVNAAAILCYTCECGDVWKDGWNPNPQYHADPAAMLVLIEAVRAKGYPIQIDAYAKFYGDAQEYRAEIYKKRGGPVLTSRFADTLPAAVSNAVLALIEKQPVTPEA